MDAIMYLITTYYWLFIILSAVLLISVLGIYVDNRKQKAEETGEKIMGKVVSKGILSLNDYFQHIEELAELAIGDGVSRTGSDPYFLRIPQDEPFFEINANTRGITVPGELSQVAVKGDKLAEILFFRIDRYYDAVDLNTRHIYIEWELPDGTKGISRDFLRDTQSEKDKIIFGWLIDDVLTSQIGAIRFAVRFVEWTKREDQAAADEKLLYSFSSLPATISVSDTLHYTLFEDDEELQYNTDKYKTAVLTLKGLFENSDSDAEDETAPEQAEAPVFVLNLGEDMGAVPVDGEEGVYTRNLIGGTKANPNGSLKIIAEAYSPDSGSIAYMYGYKPQNSPNVGTQAKSTTPDFLEVSDHSDTHRTYYIKKDNGVYLPVSQADIEELQPAHIYERIAYTIATEPGYYKVNARNRVSGKKTTGLDSYMLYIPYAAKPEVTTQMADNFVLNRVDYEKQHNENSQSGRYATSNITYVAGEAGEAFVELAPVIKASDGSAKGQKENLSYQWYKVDDIFNTDFTLAENTKLEDYAIEGATDETLRVTAPGCYALKVDNFFNNDHKETELLDAGLCRVTNMPQMPTIEWMDNDVNLWDDDIGLKTGTTIPSLKVNLGECDKFSYEWHKISEDLSDEDLVAEGMVDYKSPEGGIVVNSASSVQEIPFKPNAFGLYYLIIDVELNGAHVYLNTAEMQEYGVVYVEALQGN